MADGNHFYNDTSSHLSNGFAHHHEIGHDDALHLEWRPLTLAP